jgi:hypothetical protein
MSIFELGIEIPRLALATSWSNSARDNCYLFYQPGVDAKIGPATLLHGPNSEMLKNNVAKWPGWKGLREVFWVLDTELSEFKSEVMDASVALLPICDEELEFRAKIARPILEKRVSSIRDGKEYEFRRLNPDQFS